MTAQRKKLYIVLIFILVAAAFLVNRIYAAERMQKSISQKIIRLHVRANSDSEEDQQLKLKVKTAVVEYLKPLLADSSSIEESRNILEENTEAVLEVARQVIASEGYEYEVTAYFEESYFPLKTYGDVALPPGIYEAYRIDIGEHEGKNWWCVLYPPLCFVDETHAVCGDESLEQLSSVLDEAEYEAVTEYKLEFRYFTFLNGLIE